MTLLIFLQIDHIFLTRVCSETAGGLPGVFIDVLHMMLYFALKVYSLSKL